MRNNRIKERGITLIALVITIIVLLLLAGISISMLAGNNSVLNRAASSKSSNALGIAKDQVNLAVMTAMQDYFQSIYDGQDVSTTYTSTGLDKYIVANIKPENTDNPNYNLVATDIEFGKWTGTRTNATITLKYKPDGTTVRGTIANGVITWEAIEYKGQQDENISIDIKITNIEKYDNQGRIKFTGEYNLSNNDITVTEWGILSYNNNETFARENFTLSNSDIDKTVAANEFQIVTYRCRDKGNGAQTRLYIKYEYLGQSYTQYSDFIHVYYDDL